MFRLTGVLLDLVDLACWLATPALGLLVPLFSTGVTSTWEPAGASLEPSSKGSSRVSPDPEPKRWQTSASADGIHRGEMLDLFFLDLDLLRGFLVAHTGDEHAAISSSFFQDGFDVSSELDRLLDLREPLLQDLVPDVLPEAPAEDGVHHEQLHPLEALGHHGVGLSLR